MLAMKRTAVLKELDVSNWEENVKIHSSSTLQTRKRESKIENDEKLLLVNEMKPFIAYNIHQTEHWLKQQLIIMMIITDLLCQFSTLPIAA